MTNVIDTSDKTRFRLTPEYIGRRANAAVKRIQDGKPKNKIERAARDRANTFETSEPKFPE